MGRRGGKGWGEEPAFESHERSEDSGDSCTFKNTYAGRRLFLPRSSFLSYDAAMTSDDANVRTHIDNFSSCGRTTAVIDAESFNHTTSSCGGERLVDESRNSIWHNAVEFVDGEGGGRGESGEDGAGIFGRCYGGDDF